MYRKLLVLIVALLLFPGVVFAWTDTAHMDAYPGLGGNWSCLDSPPGYGTVITDSTTPDHPTSLKLTYPKGFLNGNYAAKCWNMFPNQLNDFWVQYYFKYSGNYYFHPTDNKQTYYFIGTGISNWYISVNGSHQVNLITQTFATDRHYPNTGYDPYINAGQWYKITAHFVMNSPGVLNGTAQIWINDQLVMDKKTIGYIGTGEAGSGAREMQIAPVFGGMSGTTKPAEDYQYYDFAIISSSPISGGPVPPQTGVLNPNPPSGLIIRSIFK